MNDAMRPHRYRWEAVEAQQVNYFSTTGERYSINHFGGRSGIAYNSSSAGYYWGFTESMLSRAKKNGDLISIFEIEYYGTFGPDAEKGNGLHHTYHFKKGALVEITKYASSNFGPSQYFYSVAQNTGGAKGLWDSFIKWLNTPVGNSEGRLITAEEIARDRAANPDAFAKMDMAANIAGFFGPGGGVKVGTAFGKLGKVVVNPGIKITSISAHAVNQAIIRGVTTPTILSIVRNPLVVLQQSSGNFLYLSRAGVVVVNPSGRVVTTYGTNYFDDAIKGILNLLN